jgi:hypothetical protein
VITPGTLVHHFQTPVEKASAVGAGLNTIAATDAGMPVDQDHTFFGSVGGSHWTNRNTGRFITVIAEFRYKKGLVNIQVFILKIHVIGFKPVISSIRRIHESVVVVRNYVPFDPGPVGFRFKRNVIFFLAGPGTTTAANTFLDINPESPIMGFRLRDIG